MKLKLRHKFILPTVILILAGMGTSSFISFNQSKKALKNIIIDQVAGQAASCSSMLLSWVGERKLNVKSWTLEKEFPGAADDSWVDNFSRRKASEKLTALKKDYLMYEDIYLSDRNGNIVSASAPEHIGKLNIAEREYFKEAFSGKLFVGRIFRSSTSGNPVFAISTPIYMDEEPCGTLTAIVDFTVFSREFISSLKIGERGFAYVVNSSGTVVTYPVKEEIFKLNLSKNRFWKAEASSDKGIAEYTLNGEENLMAFQRLEDLGCLINVTAIKDDIFTPVSVLGKTCLLSTLIICLMAAVITYLVAGTISRPIKNVVEGLKDAVQGEGDLTKRITVTSRDEVGELAKWFNIFIEKLHSIILEVRENSGELNTAAKKLTELSGLMAGGAEDTTVKSESMASSGSEVNSTIQMVAGLTQKTADNVNTVAASAEEMHTTINEIAENTNRASRYTADAVEQATEASEQIGKLGNAAAGIGNVIEVISDISEQVNLLALNATIEAARAGEAGKSFAVVANEVKSLAGQTAEATDDIKNRVEEIQATTDITVRKIGTISDVTGRVDGAVSEIAAAVEEQSAATGEIAGNVGQVSEGVMDISSSMNEASSLVESITGEIYGVNDAAARIQENSSHVSSGASNLSELAGKLDALVNQFKL